MASTRSGMCVLDLRRRFVSSDTNWILSLAIGHFIRRRRGDHAPWCRPRFRCLDEGYSAIRSAGIALIELRSPHRKSGFSFPQGTLQWRQKSATAHTTGNTGPIA